MANFKQKHTPREKTSSDNADGALVVGSALPSFDGVTWLKGEAPAGDKPLLLVEFWGVKCSPCRHSIPHLSRLATKYADTVDVVGLTSDDQATAQPFVDQKGDRLTYAMGCADSSVETAFMTGVEGIPRAFLFDAAKTLVWTGYPAEAGRLVARVASGELTTDALKDIPTNDDEDWKYTPEEERTPESSAAQHATLAALKATGWTVTKKSDYTQVCFDLKDCNTMTFVNFGDDVELFATFTPGAAQGDAGSDATQRAVDAVRKLDSIGGSGATTATTIQEEGELMIEGHFPFESYTEHTAKRIFEQLAKIIQG